MLEIDPPDGFKPFPLDHSFNDAFAPMFITMTEKGPKLALKVGKQHLNSMGICHGAVYMALMDIACASVIGHALGKYTGTPTVSLALNYMASSKDGEWLFTAVECLKLTRTLGFAQGMVKSNNQIKVSGSGVFKLPKNIATASAIISNRVGAVEGD